jgi:hypothetical protein
VLELQRSCAPHCVHSAPQLHRKLTAIDYMGCLQNVNPYKQGERSAISRLVKMMEDRMTEIAALRGHMEQLSQENLMLKRENQDLQKENLALKD